MWECLDNQDVGLEAATIQRVRNSSLVKCSRADDVTGLKLATEAVGFSASWIGRRAFPRRRSGGDKPAVEAWEERMPV